MLRILAKIVQILDDTPSEYGERRRGQSVVELALITPILITLLAGLVEVGWFANNYLTLLDVTRSGARRGTVLQDSQSPLFWDNQYSLVPQAYFDGQPGGDFFKSAYALGETDAIRDDVRPRSVTACNVPSRTFYHEIACVMLYSMTPLRFDPDNDVDDIVISGFSIENVDASEGNSDWLGILHTDWRPVDLDVPQLVVVGRYPTNANECDVAWDGAGTATVHPLEPRDPFDFNYNSMQDLRSVGADFDELDGFDDIHATVAAAEKQIGFVLYGNHRIEGTACVGSEWTMQDISQVMNLGESYNLDGNDSVVIEARRKIPGQGIIMVELFWQHRLLLNIPLLSPIFAALGSERTTISVWAAFPLPSTEPYIEFN